MRVRNNITALCNNARRFFHGLIVGIRRLIVGIGLFLLEVVHMLIALDTTIKIFRRGKLVNSLGYEEFGNNSSGENTAVLGKAKLGTMILGKD